MYVLILNFPFLAIKSEYLTLKKIRMAGSLFEEQETSGLYNIKCKNITSNLIAIKVLVLVILRRKHHFRKTIFQSLENKMCFIQPLSNDFTFVLALISYQFILNEAFNKTEN